MTNGSALSERSYTRTIWENRHEQVAMARSTARPNSARLRTTLDDRELAKLAIDGDGEAFAQLYDRHERRVYGFCLRMLGTPDEAGDATQETFMRLLGRLPALEGRDVNFIAYALTTARNACFDAIEARRRVQPVAEQLEPGAAEPSEVRLDPERAALLAATREDVRAANSRLPERQREVLALRELEQLSYEQIGEVVGLNENAVAQLISRARIRLREEIRSDALGSIAAFSLDCERALPLLARLQDAQTSATDELDWLDTHMASCETCRLSRAAMEEAGVSYRALGPIVVLAWLRHTTIARAAQFVGADWSHIAGRAHEAAGGGHATTPSSTAPGSTRTATSDTQIVAAGHKDVRGRTQAATRRIRPLSAVSARGTTGRRSRWMPAAAILCAVLVVILVVVLAGSVTPDNRVLSRVATQALSSTTAAQADGHQLAHATGPTHRASHSANPSLVRGHGATPVVVGSGRGAQLSTPTPAVHRAHRVTRHRSTHQQSTTPVTPTSGTPTSPQPATTTPTSTTPAPSPPSGGSGSTGSGSGTSTGGGETSPPAETSASPPGGGPTETAPSCALAIAC